MSGYKRSFFTNNKSSSLNNRFRQEDHDDEEEEKTFQSKKIVLLSSPSKKNENKTTIKRKTPIGESHDGPNNPGLWDAIQAMPSTSDTDRARKYTCQLLYENQEMAETSKQKFFAQYGIEYVPEEEEEDNEVDVD